MKDDRSHSSLMIFIGAIDIEKFQPCPEIRFLILLQRPFIKFILTDPIRIERMQFFTEGMIVVVSEFSSTVSSRRGGINQWQTIFHAFFPDHFGILQIELIQKLHIEFSGIRTGSQMKNELHEILILIQPLCEL